MRNAQLIQLNFELKNKLKSKVCTSCLDRAAVAQRALNCQNPRIDLQEMKDSYEALENLNQSAIYQ